MDESAEHFCGTSWFQIGANSEIFPQDSSSGWNWFADTKGAIRAERRQQLLRKTSRQLNFKPSFQVSWNSRNEIQAYIEAHRRQLAFKTVAAWNTSDPMDGDIFGKGGKKGKIGKKGGKGQNQSQNPNLSKHVGCWHSGEKSHLRRQCWSNPKNQFGSRAKTKEAKERQRSGLFGTRRPTCSGGTTPATDSCDLSGLGIV